MFNYLKDIFVEQSHEERIRGKLLFDGSIIIEFFMRDEHGRLCYNTIFDALNGHVEKTLMHMGFDECTIKEFTNRLFTI